MFMFGTGIVIIVDSNVILLVIVVSSITIVFQSRRNIFYVIFPRIIFRNYIHRSEYRVAHGATNRKRVKIS